jgi:hypothetical protein
MKRLLPIALAISMLSTAAAEADSTQVIYRKGPVAIPDGKGSAALTFNAAPAPAGELVFSPSSYFRVRHKRTRDLVLLLKAPNGEVRKLSNRDTRGRHLGSGACGATSDPSTLYTGFSPESSDPVTESSAPYVGLWSPARSLTGIIGIEPQGQWKLIARDVKDGRRGKLLCGILDIFTKPA